MKTEMTVKSQKEMKSLTYLTQRTRAIKKMLLDFVNFNTFHYIMQFTCHLLARKYKTLTNGYSTSQLRPIFMRRLCRIERNFRKIKCGIHNGKIGNICKRSLNQTFGYSREYSKRKEIFAIYI